MDTKSKERVQVRPGYYGLAISSVHDCVESIGDDLDGQQALRNILDATEPGLALFPAGDGVDCFYVVQRIPGGGIVASLGSHALRADTPGEAYEHVVKGAAAYPNRPFIVTWLETVNRVLN